MRVFVPATFDMLGTLAKEGQMPVRSGIGFFNDPAPPEIYPLPLHDALPI